MTRPPAPTAWWVPGFAGFVYQRSPEFSALAFFLDDALGLSPEATPERVSEKLDYLKKHNDDEWDVEDLDFDFDQALDAFHYSVSAAEQAQFAVERAVIEGRWSDILTLLVDLKLVDARRVIKLDDPFEAASPLQSVAPPDVGGVYFTRQKNCPSCGAAGPVKIGFSARSIRRRLAELQAANPYPLELVGFFPTAGQDVETTLHRRFARLRLQGEWFAPSPDLLALAKAGS